MSQPSGLPVTLSCRVYRGDTFRATYRWGYRPSGSTVVGYYPLAGFSAVFTFRKPGSTEELARVTEADGITLDEAPNGSSQPGWIQVRVDADVTETFPPGPIEADLELTDEEGTRTTIVRLTGRVEEDVSTHV